MGQNCPYSFFIFIVGIAILFLTIISGNVSAQNRFQDSISPVTPVVPLFPNDSSLRSRAEFNTVLYNKDSSNIFLNIFNKPVDPAIFIRNFGVLELGVNPKRTWIKINNGSVEFNTTYRSVIDTPFNEQDILQHNITTTTGFVVADKIPAKLSVWSRQSNSKIIRDITDFQLLYDASTMRNMIFEKYRVKQLQLADNLYDSLSDKLLGIKSSLHKELSKWLSSPFQKQKLIEYREIVLVDGITFQKHLSKNQNIAREDSIRILANKFLSLYKNTQEKYQKLVGEVDSLKSIVRNSRARVDDIKQLLQVPSYDYASFSQLNQELRKKGMAEVEIPAFYKFLTGVKSFGLGRNMINYSDLTAQNISVNGINLEYNSWYYASVTAGLVDFRFREINIRNTRVPQHMYLMRVGIGQKNNTSFIVSAYGGRKQLFAANENSSRLATVNTKGISFQGRYQISKKISLVGEFAESNTPRLRDNSISLKSPFSFSDFTNKAASVRLQGSAFNGVTRFEGYFKYTGADFQSFSSYQTNASRKIWHGRVDQYFLKKIIKLSAAFKSNEFNNPFIIQTYSSGNISTNVSLTFRKKGLPVVSVGYLPVSQLTILEDNITENIFQSINANVYHYYKIGGLKTSTALTFNKFENKGTDSSYIYFNARNIFFSQTLFFNTLSAGVSISHTSNSNFELSVFEENIKFRLGRNSNITMGVKINNYNYMETKIGAYASTGFSLGPKDMVFLSYEKGFLPGFSNGLIRNEMGSIQYSRKFGSW